MFLDERLFKKPVQDGTSVSRGQIIYAMLAIKFHSVRQIKQPMFAILTNAKIITICSLARFALLAALTTYLESTHLLNTASQRQRQSAQGSVAVLQPVHASSVQKLFPARSEAGYQPTLKRCCPPLTKPYRPLEKN